MLYRRINDPQGDYTTETSSRVTLLQAESMSQKLRSFYTEFESLKECLEAWHLTYDPLPDPEKES